MSAVASLNMWEVRVKDACQHMHVYYTIWAVPNHLIQVQLSIQYYTASKVTIFEKQKISYEAKYSVQAEWNHVILTLKVSTFVSSFQCVKPWFNWFKPVVIQKF